MQNKYSMPMELCSLQLTWYKIILVFTSHMQKGATCSDRWAEDG